MDRREMFGGLVGALGAGSVACAGHDDKGGATGANPMNGPHAHFCGIHMAKNNPKFQVITQHYCAAHTQDGEDAMFQCVLFDTTGKNAKLLGVEYLISDAAYRKLPAEELKYWHSHTYEVLGGGLIAPGMPRDDEMKFMKMVLTTWGKAWHTWPDPSTKVPMGDPLLIWSLTADGQVDPKLVAQRDKDFKVSNDKIREVRGKEIGMEMPKVSLPKDMNTVGRQWTDNGDDKPTKKK
ncbi:MAG TPA: DUF1264 domain-containing protein [Gemmataceae bacterium]|nr:DUF1264 domain-containing protein [Gemmataceae bacterium]